MNDKEINNMCNPPNDKSMLRAKVYIKELQNRISNLVYYNTQQNSDSVESVMANHHQVLLVLRDRVLLFMVFRTSVEI